MTSASHHEQTIRKAPAGPALRASASRSPALRSPASCTCAPLALVAALAVGAMLLVSCRDEPRPGPPATTGGPSPGSAAAAQSAASAAARDAAASLPDGPTGLRRPVQLVYELDVRRLPREWQPYGETDAATRLAAHLRGLLQQRGLVGRVVVQLQPDPTIRLSFADLLPTEQDALKADIAAQRQASQSPLGGLRLATEHVGQDPLRVAEACGRRASSFVKPAADARALCAAWAAIPDPLRHCLASRDLWGQVAGCTAGGKAPPGALVTAAQPCLDAHPAEAHFALHGGLEAIVDLAQPAAPDGAALTAALRKGLGKGGPPCTVKVTGRPGAFRLQVRVAYPTDPERDLEAFKQTLAGWLAPGAHHRLTFQAVRWVGPAVSSYALGQHCELLTRLPQGLAHCLGHPALQALCAAARNAPPPAPAASSSASPLGTDHPDH